MERHPEKEDRKELFDILGLIKRSDEFWLEDDDRVSLTNRFVV
ncbi:hypothetical protein KMI_11g17280 [Encephalitozoon hellem]|nr:hypothetical protein KMI_11g17280 [Encephalitozoon hellem]